MKTGLAVITAIMATLTLTTTTTLGQSIPPPVWYTNFFHMEVRYATDGIHFTNIAMANGYAVATDRENDSTNSPWANGFEHIPFNPIYYDWTGYPTNKIICYWTWNLDRFDVNNFTYNGKTYNCQTNWLQATNDPDSCCGTLIQFSPYPPDVVSTNTAVQYLSYHTDGNTLSFAHNLNGPWTWSGSPNYRQPTYYLIYPFVRGVSTDGSVNPVHLWTTNEHWENGVLLRKEVITK